MKFPITADRFADICKISAADTDDGKSVQKFTWLCFVSIILLMLPGIFFNDIPMRDVSLRYAPMADALTRGDWAYAFHPRVPVLFPLLAGVVSFVFGCDGFIGCKAASALLLALTVFPFIRIMRQICPGKVWKLAAFFFVFSSPVMEFAFEGLRDSGKVLVLVLLADVMFAIYRNGKKCFNYLLLGLYCGCGILFRSEMLLPALLLLTLAMYWEYGHSKLPGRTVAALGVQFILLLLPTLCNLMLIGRAVPDFRYDLLVRMITGSEPQFWQFALLYAFGISFMVICCRLLRMLKSKTVLFLTAAAIAAITALGIVRLVMSKDAMGVATVYDYIETFLDGCDILMLIPALVAVILKIKLKRWSAADSVVAAVLLIHAFAVAIQVIIFDGKLYISQRYLIPATVLEYGWAALFFCWIANIVGNTFPGRQRFLGVLWIILLTLYAAVSVWQTNKLIYRFRWGKSRETRELYMDCSAAIKKDWQQKTPVKRQPPELNIYWYIANRPMKINFLVHSKYQYTATDDKMTTLAYLADGSYDPFGNCLGDADYYVVMRTNSFAPPVFTAKTKLLFSRPTTVYDLPGVYEIYGVER